MRWWYRNKHILSIRKGKSMFFALFALDPNCTIPLRHVAMKRISDRSGFVFPKMDFTHWTRLSLSKFLDQVKKDAISTHGIGAIEITEMLIWLKKLKQVLMSPICSKM